MPGWGKRCAGTVLLVAAVACGGGSSDPDAGDAAAGDAGAVGDGAATDAFPRDPYEVDAVPGCDEPELWELAPTVDLTGAYGDCGASYLHPLFRFEIRPLPHGRDDELRACWRIREQSDSGWEAGTIVETGPGEAWRGYVAGRWSRMTLDLRVLFEDGHLAVTDGITFGAKLGEAGEPVERIRAITRQGSYTTPTAVSFRNGDTESASEPIGLAEARNGTVWLESGSEGAELRRSYMVRRGTEWERVTVEVPLEGSAREGAFLVHGGGSLFVVLGTTVHQLTTFSYEVERTATLDAVPDEVRVMGDGLLVARFGETAEVWGGGEDGTLDRLEVGPGLAEGVRGFVQLPAGDYRASLGVWTEDAIARLLQDDDRVTAEPLPEVTVDPRIGRPLALLHDGRLIGRDGTVGPPLEPGPRFVSSEAMYGGPIVDAGLLLHSPSWGAGEAEGWLVARTPEGDVPVEVGWVHPDACGL